MHLHENESVFSFLTHKDEDILFDGFNLLDDGKEDEVGTTVKRSVQTQNHDVNGNDKVTSEVLPGFSPHPVLRVNPQLRMMMMQRNFYVNPNDVCRDPFYEPKKVSKYPSVYVRQSIEKTMSPEGPVGMDGIVEEMQSKENVKQGVEENVKSVKDIEYTIENEVIESVKEMEDSETDGDVENSQKRKNDEDDEPNGYKLPASKSPIMEAMSFCAIKKWGIEIEECKDKTEDSNAQVIFRVTDFEKYYKYSTLICSKQNPTEDIGSRVKSLRRWFTNFPKKKDRKDNSPFSLEVRPDVSKKVHDMVEKYRLMVNVKKRRRMK